VTPVPQPPFLAEPPSRTEAPAGSPDRRRAWLLTAASIAIAFALLTAAVASRVGGLLRIDHAISAALRRVAQEHPLWVSVLRFMTHTGDTATLAPIGALLIALLIWRRRWPALCFLVTAEVIANAVRLGTLVAVGRPRPQGGFTSFAGHAYPSGHTTNSATAAMILAVLLWPLLRARWQRVVLIVAAAGWAGLVAFSRVALLVHWPTDVLGGWLVATLAGSVAALVTELVFRRRPTPT
jgi:undecaprenyl-diphosphatase